MADIGITVNLDGAYLPKPSVPANGQEGTPTNSLAQNSVFFTYSSIASDDIRSTIFFEGLTYKSNGAVNLPTPIITYYILTATLAATGIREYWTSRSVSFTDSPSGGGAYISNSLTILNHFNVTG